MKRATIVGTAALACACASSTIDVTPPEAGPPPDTGAVNPHEAGASSPPQTPPPRPIWPDPSSCVATSDLPIVGTWKGYREGHPAPWDTLNLVIRGASERGGVCGTLTFGTAPPPPPATDPNVGYPPDVTANGVSHLPTVTEGFPLTLLEGSVKDGRVRFRVGFSEVRRGWCALQTVYPDTTNPGLYGCLPNAGTRYGPSNCGLITESGSFVPHDCGKVLLCGLHRACSCDATSCEASPDYGTAFDLHFDAAEADGKGDRFVRAE